LLEAAGRLRHEPIRPPRTLPRPRPLVDARVEISLFRHEGVSHPWLIPPYARLMATRNAKALVRTAATPWGTATVIEEVAVKQQAGDRRFSVVVQLLEARNGERLIRFAYTTDGAARRGPVTMRTRDLERLRTALEKAPALGEVLGL
jgi:hypothetical protein